MLEQILGITRQELLEVRYYRWQNIFDSVNELNNGIISKTLKESCKEFNKFIYKTKDEDKSEVNCLIDSIFELSQNSDIENKRYIHRLRKINERINRLRKKTLS